MTVSRNPAYDTALDTVTHLVGILTRNGVEFDQAVDGVIKGYADSANSADESKEAGRVRMVLRVAVDVKNGFVSPRLGNVRSIVWDRVMTA